MPVFFDSSLDSPLFFDGSSSFLGVGLATRANLLKEDQTAELISCDVSPTGQFYSTRQSLIGDGTAGESRRSFTNDYAGIGALRTPTVIKP